MTEKEKEEFAAFLKKTGTKIPRIRRKYSDLDCQQDSTSQDSEESNEKNAQNLSKERK